MLVACAKVVLVDGDSEKLKQLTAELSDNAFGLVVWLLDDK